MILWIKIEVTDNNIHQFSKLKQYRNANIANFVYYGINSISWKGFVCNTFSSTGDAFLCGVKYVMSNFVWNYYVERSCSPSVHFSVILHINQEVKISTPWAMRDPIGPPTAQNFVIFYAAFREICQNRMLGPQGWRRSYWESWIRPAEWNALKVYHWWIQRGTLPTFRSNWFHFFTVFVKILSNNRLASPPPWGWSPKKEILDPSQLLVVTMYYNTFLLTSSDTRGRWLYLQTVIPRDRSSPNCVLVGSGCQQLHRVDAWRSTSSDGSKGDVSDASPGVSKFFRFMQFSAKTCKIIGKQNHFGGWRPLGKTLDPPPSAHSLLKR